jgi:hypothetical protein
VNTVPLTAGATTCSFNVTVVSPAVFTLGGAPGACATPTIAGTYVVSIPLNGTNTVTLNVNVTTAGAYNVSTTAVGGMTFSGSGTLALGPQTITLTGSGTPNTGGANVVLITVGTTTCNFTITVSNGAAYTINCGSVVVNGTYQAGTPLGASNTITLPITVTTAGPYTISASINGMTFASTGTLTLASTTITLTGTGTPTAAGPFNLSVGTPACSIPITVSAAPTIDWKFNIGATVYQGQSSLPDITLDNTTLPPFSLFSYAGDNAASDAVFFDFLDLTGGINATETYNSSSVGLTNASDFYFTDGAGTIDLSADQSTSGATMIFKVTSHNTTTKTIIGTFSGTALDAISNTNKTITSGTFTAVYQ